MYAGSHSLAGIQFYDILGLYVRAEGMRVGTRSHISLHMFNTVGATHPNHIKWEMHVFHPKTLYGWTLKDEEHPLTTGQRLYSA
jgi:hypothetical protein